jgi:hypothetical protein
MKMTTGALYLALALAMVLGLAGCSTESMVPVKGRVHKNGQPLAVKELPSGAGGRVMVLFHRVDQGAKPLDPQSAIVQADGTFSLPGASGSGIPPGKYCVEVRWQDPFPMGQDKLQGKFSKEKSQVIVDIPSPGEIDINVASVTDRP